MGSITKNLKSVVAWVMYRNSRREYKVHIGGDQKEPIISLSAEGDQVVIKVWSDLAIAGDKLVLGSPAAALLMPQEKFDSMIHEYIQRKARSNRKAGDPIVVEVK
jgi:hypothetical protein